jgi:flagellar biosynthesis protein FlhF
MKVSDKTAPRGKRMMPRAFRAKTVPAAMAAVEKALGSRALIVSVHPISTGPAWRLWRRSGVEVVAMPSAVDALYSNPTEHTESGVAEEKPVSPPSAAQIPASVPSSGDPPRVPPPSISTPADPSVPAELPPHLAALQERLLNQGVDGTWLSRTLQSIQENTNDRILGDEGLTRELVRQELLRCLRSDGGVCLIRRKVIFLIGSSGCGKTSSCAKIASYALKSLGKQVHWISGDTTRAGAIAKAQAFTAPLGIPLHLTYRPEELPSLVRRNLESEISLVDTPGCNPYRKDEIEELDEILSQVPDRHVLWVAPATAKESDLRDMHAAFLHLGVAGVVVTRLDETRSLGEIFNFLYHSQLPVAFLIHGPRIRGDLHTGETSLLVSLLLDEKPLK